MPSRSKAKRQLPEWLPRPVAIEAVGIARDSPDHAQSAWRLATDPRMRTVWAQLAKMNRRADDRYSGTAGELLGKAPCSGNAHSAECYGTESSCPMRVLFYQAVVGYKQLPWHGGMRKQHLRHYRERAETLHHIYTELNTLHLIAIRLPAPFWQLYKEDFPRESLLSIADYYDSLANYVESCPEMDVHRHRIDTFLHSFIINFMSNVRQLYGTPCYGIVSTIASVLSQGEVTRSLVRSIGRRHSRVDAPLFVKFPELAGKVIFPPERSNSR
jgi:hypothetical protein